MRLVAATLGLLVVLALLPRLTRAWSGASPRTAAGAYLVSLVGWGLLPAVWLACLGGSIGSWAAGIGSSGGGCLFGWSRGEWQMLGYAPAAVTWGLLVWHAVAVARAARRTELRGPALEGAIGRAAQGAWVWVVPSAEPAAFAGGLWRPRAVVTSALLASLDNEERRAVCAHEAAHVRLGHPRVLLFGGTVAGAFGRFPPVSQAWDGLRRELEAAADDEAVRAVGRGPVLSALARMALAKPGPAVRAAGFGDVEHLRYRLSRLEDPRPIRRVRTVAVGSSAAALTAMMAWSACVLAGVHADLTGVLVCLSGVGAVGARPMWAWRRSFAGRSSPAS